MRVTLNAATRGLHGYSAEIVSFEPPHFFEVRPEGCRDTVRVTPGHMDEEDEVVDRWGLERVSARPRGSRSHRQDSEV